jgi:putative glutamine amidotransferase
VPPRIAFPEPHSAKPDYNARSIPQYRDAVIAAGGELVVLPLNATNEEIARTISTCDAILLPGSPADIDPEKFDEPRNPKTSDADPKRDNADELLIQDAFNMRKPILGICYGIQSLNVWKTGSLVQHIESRINHEAGRDVPVAHKVKVETDSLLGSIARTVADGDNLVPVNSSHHQSVDRVGDGLRAVATCPEDDIIEAIEGTDRNHFVLGVQWHPERGYASDPFSQAIFARFISAAAKYQPKKNG